MIKKKSLKEANMMLCMFVISFAAIIGFSESLLAALTAKKMLTLEQSTAEIIQLEKGVTEIFVANPDVADIQLNSPKVAYVFAKKPGVTTVFAADGNGNTVLNLAVHVQHNLSQLKKAIRDIFPEEDIKIYSSPEGVILDGSVSGAKVAQDIQNVATRYLGADGSIVNRLSIATPTQVYLKVKVAEVSRTVLNQLDINWGAVTGSGRFSFGVLTGRNPLNVAGDAFARSDAIPRLNGIGLRRSGQQTDIATLLDALSQEGLGTILAEPNLVALSGETASVLVGGEFPYPVPNDENITIEFKRFGISLAFTPTVLSCNSVNLRVRPEVSELDRSNGLEIPLTTQTSIQVPAIRTRRAETSLELGPGQSMVIAGLFSNSQSSIASGVPGLQDIPVLGALFRSTQFMRNQTELVITVTVDFVKPGNRDAFKLPTDGLKHSQHLDMIFGQQLNRLDNLPEGQEISASGDEQNISLMGSAGFYTQ